MKNYKITFDSKDEYLHYYIDDIYLGMLVFKKRELSDFRAIVRKNRIGINNDNINKTIRVSLFELLNHYLKEREFLNEKELQHIKSKIVKKSEKIIQQISKRIVEKGLL
ncbi:MAG: hypothetical protein ACWA5P_02340 [bacterium]